MQVSIIIVSFNCKEYVIECINTILEHTKEVQYEIIVVDNNSVDNIEEELANTFQNVLFLKSECNCGFGFANNIGLSRVKGEYVFFLNPDTLLLNDTCKILYDFMENNINVAAVGARVFDEKHNNQISFGRFPSVTQYLFEVFPLKIFLKKIKTNKSSEGFISDGDDVVDVDFISGADLFARKSILDQIGYFDEKFFLFFEEVDLCRRMKMAGYDLKIIAEAKIIHLMGKTMKVSFQKFKWFEESRYIFLKKYYSKKFIVFSKSIFIFRYLFLWLKYLDKKWHKRAVFIYKLK